jgi:hypothetical protein
MNLYFTQGQKQNILRKWGFNIQEVECKFSQNVYHNDIEFWTKKKMGVFTSGVEFKKPNHSREFEDNEWIDQAFEAALVDNIYRFFIQEKRIAPNQDT